MINKIDSTSLFKYALDHIQEILKESDVDIEIKKLYDMNSLCFIEKSIDYVLYNKLSHLNNTYKIDLDIENKESKRVGSYTLYLDDNEEFIDEFFMIDSYN
ncbi:hypothetical protein [Chryseobacterium sp. PMSZPI]|uniref:hypothetical protein n=1 Tax=Chryseobacterium sp. PMSZPI TaxID=1033900 RepID=UPI000C336EB1|nr:hypothetical protein [Chryseobacterium sp. PMSZPI]PKF74195.1 hypothetical protein CW752_09700 [Chryseobacterium sp. PMSZPI]